MAAGPMKGKVKVQRWDTGATNDYGNVEPDWADHIGTRAVEIKALGGSEMVRADRVTGITRFEVRFRYSAAVLDIKASDRLVVTRAAGALSVDAELNVKAPPTDPTGKRRLLIVICEHGTPS